MNPDDYAVTTTAGEQLTYRSIALLAHAIYVRFGRNMESAAQAYARMLQSTVDTADFSALVQMARQELAKS